MKKTQVKSSLSSGKKWFNLIDQVKEENQALAEIIKKGTDERTKSNLEYFRFRQQSFNSIHNIKKSTPSSPMSPNKMQRSKSVRRENQTEKRGIGQLSSFAVMEFETPVTNVDRWPKRNSAAKRILSPVKLKDYGNIRKKRDMFILSGDVIPPQLASTL